MLSDGRCDACGSAIASDHEVVFGVKTYHKSCAPPEPLKVSEPPAGLEPRRCERHDSPVMLVQGRLLGPPMIVFECRCEVPL